VSNPPSWLGGSDAALFMIEAFSRQHSAFSQETVWEPSG